MPLATNEPTCVVARVVNAALDEVLSQAEALVMAKQVEAVPLADLATEFDAICRAAGWGTIKNPPPKRSGKKLSRAGKA